MGSLRQKVLQRSTFLDPGSSYDAFILECFSPDEGEFRIVLEYWDGARQLKLRRAFDVVHGDNFHTIPAEGFDFPPNKAQGKLLLYPENDVERRLVFTWLDFAKLREGFVLPQTLANANGGLAAPKIKCVARDLDNLRRFGHKNAELRLAASQEGLVVLRSSACGIESK